MLYIKILVIYICFISTNAVTENNLTQNAVSLKELWKKRRGATLSGGKPDHPGNPKIAIFFYDSSPVVFSKTF
jgi:hypothetical protein